MERPTFIKHFSEIQGEDQRHYPGSDELMSIGSPFGKVFGLKKLGIHHELLPPGRRTSWPHAEQDEEEFVYVIEGNPEAWINGVLHKLSPGDGVGFPCGTGISHTFINKTDQPVRLLVVGEKSKPESKIYYPLHPCRREQCKDTWWHEVPRHDIGPHDGLPDSMRTPKASPPLNFTGEIIAESLMDDSLFKLLRRPYKIKHRTAEMPNEEVKLWNIHRFVVDEPTLHSAAPQIEGAINSGGWYIHFFSDTGNKMYVFFRGKHFVVSKFKDETWKPMIEYGESIGVEKRWTETIPIKFMV